METLYINWYKNNCNFKLTFVIKKIQSSIETILPYALEVLANDAASDSSKVSVLKYLERVCDIKSYEQVNKIVTTLICYLQCGFDNLPWTKEEIAVTFLF